MTVSVRSQWWAHALALGVAPAMVLGILLVPEGDREASNREVLLLTLGTFVVTGLVLLAAYYFRGGDSFTADAQGLRTRSRKHGDRTIAWSDILELGWVVSGRYAPGGLAGRMREGGQYERGGPNIATWLAHPTGRLTPRNELLLLRTLCAEHGVTWRDYGPAEVL